MFRFNQKKANREVDELKKLLAITKGMKSPSKSISSSFLREDVDMVGNPTQTPTPTNEPSLDSSNTENLAQTDETKKIESAIENSKIENATSEDVKGFVLASGEDDDGLHFSFDKNSTSPKIFTKGDKEIILDEDMVKSIGQISAYFDTWKDSLEK